MGKDRQIDVMGIVNLTDDSFYEGSRCVGVDAAVSRIGAMLEEGADIIDLGACSTRPGSLPVGEKEEWARLEPVLKAARAAFPDARFSIDTYWASVVRNAYDLIGDFIVNDISAGEDDPMMLPVVGELGLTYIAMHKRGTPESMQGLSDYSDVVEDVKAYFEEFSEKAEHYGIRNWVLDPGIGFAKTGGNYAASLAAQVKAHDAGYSQVLWLDGVERKYIEEVGAMNIFFKIDGEIVTPMLNGSILPGITRDSVLTLCRDWGYKVSERKISVEELLEAQKTGKLEEVFGTGTAAVISPVGKLRYKDDVMTIGDGSIGEVSQRLYDTVTGIQLGKLEDKFGWRQTV